MKVIKLERTTLKIWLVGTSIERELQFISSQIKRMEQEFDFQTEIRMMTWNRAFDAIVDAFKNNSAPDIFSTGTTWVNTFSYLNYLAPVPQTYNMRPVLAPWLEDVIRVKGTVFAVPFLAEVYLLEAKQRNLDTIGIRGEDLKDWESFFASCMKIAQYFKERGIDHIPLAFPLRPETATLHRYSVWLYKGGWTFPRLHNGIESIFRNETSIKTLSFLSKILRAQGAALLAHQTDTQSMLDRFRLSDDVFTFFVGNGRIYVINLLNDTGHRSVSLYPLPSLVPDAKTFGGGSVLAVASTCRHQELAWRVVEQLSGEEMIMGLSKCNGFVSPYEDQFWHGFEQDPNMQVIRNEFRNSCTYTNHPILRVLEQTAGDSLAHYFWDSIVHKESMTGLTADQALAELDGKLIDALKMMWELEEDETGRGE